MCALAHGPSETPHLNGGLRQKTRNILAVSAPDALPFQSKPGRVTRGVCCQIPVDPIRFHVIPIRDFVSIDVHGGPVRPAEVNGTHFLFSTNVVKKSVVLKFEYGSKHGGDPQFFV
jgi:hypothetical protein